jgi:hypothetical protein
MYEHHETIVHTHELLKTSVHCCEHKTRMFIVMNTKNRAFMDVNRRYTKMSTKTIRVSKDVYMSLLYCKKRNLKESMTKTIEKLLNGFQFDCTPEKLDTGGDDEPEFIFIMKSNVGISSGIIMNYGA